MIRAFVIPGTVFCLMLFIPGYLALRSIRLPRAWALGIAPVVTYGLIGLLGEAYLLFDIPTIPATVFAPLVIAPAAILGVREVKLRRMGGARTTDLSLPDLPLWIPGVFALVGLAAFRSLVLLRMGSPNAVNQAYDVVHHLTVIQGFVDSQTISSLHIWRYLSPSDQAIAPYGFPGIYPAVWHGVCALLVEMLGIRVPMAVNASMIVIIGMAWPLSLCAFVALAFENDRRTLLFTMLTCIAFVVFPWCLLLFGPLYPNLTGFALAPATGTILMIMVREGLSRRQRIGTMGAFFFAGAGQTLLHPSTVFTVVVLMMPYLSWRIWNWAHIRRGWGLLGSGALTAAFIGTIAVIWIGCYYSPLFASATREVWPGFAYPWQEVINILTQTYTLFFFGEYAAQIALGIAVFIGAIRAAYNPKRRWVLVSYLLFCAIAFVGATHYKDLLKRILAGFWYTDGMRLASMCCVTAAPLAAYGLSWLSEQVEALVERYNTTYGHKSHPRLATAAVGITFLLLNFMPGFNWPGMHSEKSQLIDEYRSSGQEYLTNTIRTTFGDYRYEIGQAYQYHNPIDIQETEFLEDIAPIVGNDLVINNPMDGSVLAYGMNGIRTYYRNFRGYGGPRETAESLVIRLSLGDYSTNPEVSQAVEAIDARWVLLLNTANSSSSLINLRSNYNTEDFAGVQAISPDTPGFELVTQDGACALYRIIR